MKIRQDAWTEENDLLLAETVLRHVREGSTQLNAFEEVGDKLNRTSAACGFRWNAVVRHQYEKALDLAKKQRKQRQRLLGKDQGGKKKLLYQPPTPTLNLEASLVPEEFGEELPLELLSEPRLLPAPRPEAQAVAENMNLDAVINYLQNLQNNELRTDIFRTENERLKRELADLRHENKRLSEQIGKLENSSATMQEDYETMMKILNRARKHILFDEEDRSSTSFKMDKNGNLEKLAE